MSRNRPQPAKALIIGRGERIKDVAAAVGIGETSFYAVLSGQVAPWPSLSEKVSRYLDVPAEECWHDDRTVADAARRLVQATRRAQGLPPTVTDVGVLEKVATIVASLPDRTATTAAARRRTEHRIAPKLDALEDRIGSVEAKLADALDKGHGALDFSPPTTSSRRRHDLHERQQQPHRRWVGEGRSTAP